jgi:hypothetical protein
LSCQGIAERATRRVVESFRLFGHDGLSHLHLIRTRKQRIRQDLVRARQLDEPLHRWVVWADEAEQERLLQYHQRAIGDDFRHRWTDAPLAE